MKKNIILLILISVVLGCSTQIKSITEFSSQDAILNKNRIAEFDKEGNKLFEQNFGNPRSNRITKSDYKNGVKILEIDCDYFQKEDTCVVRQFSKFEYDIKNRLLTETKFEEDSAIRFIRNHINFKDMKVVKTMSWEMFPVVTPNYDEAVILSDTIYYDKLKREIKRVHHNPDFDKPWIEIFKYSRNGYSKEYIGISKDTIEYFKYNKLQKKAFKNKIDFDFTDMKIYKYKFSYY